jgi:hypothetical protein
MKKISISRILIILLPLAAVLTMPALTQRKDQGTQQVGKVSRPSTVTKRKVFTPRMASLIRQYRGMVASAGLWRRTGAKVVKGPSIRPSTARSVPHNAKVSGQGSGSGGSTSDASYNIRVSASDVTKTDGSQHIMQTITTECSDGSSYTDTITYDDDGQGHVTESQSVSATDPNGTTITESTNDELGAAGGADLFGCLALECDQSDACCAFCPKSSPRCGDVRP